jgi:hypothetical protein
LRNVAKNALEIKGFSFLFDGHGEQGVNGMTILSNGHIPAMFRTIRDRMHDEQGFDRGSYLPNATLVELMARLKVAKSSLSAGNYLQTTNVIDALLDELASRRLP